MAALAKAFVRVEADDKPFLNSINKAGKDGASSLHKSMKEAGGTSGKAFGDVFYKTGIGPIRALGAAAAGLFLGAKTLDFFKSSIAEARESNKVSAITAQVIKTTGSAANVTAGQVNNLANAISNKTGIDDEQIQSSENLLLTFTNVRNEVGKGNDIFNQATQSVTDMSAALGQDAKSSAIQLGKALNDPIKGITALQRVGVSFTAEQKKQIDTLVKSGHTLDAQKIILHELNREFGGTAAASTTAGQKMSVTWKNFEEMIGKLLVPALDLLETAFSALITNVGPPVAAMFKTIGTAVSDFVHGFTVGVDSLSDPQTKAAQLGAQLYTVWTNDLLPAIKAAIPIFESVAGVIGATLAKILPVVVNLLTQHLIPAFVAIVNVIRTDVMPIVVQIAGFIADKLAPALGKILAVAIDAARKAFEKIGKALHDHQKQINEVLHAIEGLISFILKFAVPVIKVTLKVAFDILGTAITALIDVVSALVGAFNWLSRAAKLVWAAIKTVVVTQVHAISTVITTTMNVIKKVWSVAWNAVKAVVSAVWAAMKAYITVQINAVKAVISAVLNTIKSIWSSGWNAVSGAVSTAWHAISSTISSTISTITGWVNSFVNTLKGIPGRLAHGFDHMFDGMKNAFRSSVNFIIRGWNSLQFTLPKVNTHIPGVGTIGGWTLGTPDIPLLAAGGSIMRAGVAVVGDAGPELVFLPRGASVMPLHGGTSMASFSQRPTEADPTVDVLREQTRVIAELLRSLPAAMGAAVGSNLNGVAQASAHQSRGMVPVY